MHGMNLVIVLTIILSPYATHGLTLGKQAENPRLLLISYDGFRASYIREHYLPTFKKFMDAGVYAQTKSMFSTLTFPNHYTIATGLTEEHHGIVGNTMYDKFMNESFSMSCCNYNNSWWQQNPNVMPIWIANQLAGNGRKSGAVGFVGSLSPICDHKISKVVEYATARPFKEIVDTMVQWFTDPIDPLNFVSIYFYEPDTAGHSYGPNSVEVGVTLQKCDSLLAYIEEQMKMNNIWDNTNIIITTDHGMAEVDPIERAVVLESYIDLSTCIVKNSLSIANIYASDIQTVLSIKKNLSNIPHYNAYLREEVPAEYFYSKNIRIGDVVFVPDTGYLIFNTEEARNTSTIRGTHGYNNSDPEMQGIFMAKGPAIATNLTTYDTTINLTDVYPLMTEILQIPRRKVDGSYDTIQKFLKIK